jgi:glycosyltransferase involved in cell wall biosynthesis
MVVRNVDQFLAQAIESILDQTFSDFEFVILDFGSTDRSKSIACSYAARDKRIRLHEILACGLAEARNAACFLAAGQYIAIQDADDISLPNRLLWEVEFMQKHPGISLLGGAAQWIDSQERSLWTCKFPTEHQEIRSALETYCPFSQTSVLMRRDAFIAVNGYRAAFAPSEDYDLWLRISERFRSANLKQAVVKYRIHPQQVSLSRREHQVLCAVAARVSANFRKIGRPDPLDSIDVITPSLLNGLGLSPAELQASFFVYYRRWIFNLFAAKEYSAALKTAAEVLQTDWKYVERREIAYLHRILAQVYWRRREFYKAIFEAYLGVTLALDRHIGEKVLRRFWKSVRA